MCKYAAELNKKGYNCCKCVYKAICESSRLRISDEEMELLGGISGGFGIGGICSALIGTICALSRFFDEDEIKEKRLKLLIDFQERFSSINCATLTCKNDNCEEMLCFLESWAEEEIKKHS